MQSASNIKSIVSWSCWRYIGAVIGFIFGIIVSGQPKTVDDISGYFLAIGLIIAALGSLIYDIRDAF